MDADDSVNDWSSDDESKRQLWNDGTDKRRSYAAIRSDFSSLRVSYALSQRDRSVAKSSATSAVWPPVAFWDISATAFALVLVAEVCNAMSDVEGGTAAGSEAEASVVNRWMAGIAVVDGAACSER
jgi:hypothetical protein